MTEQQKYMKAALRLAQKAAEEGEVPVGAGAIINARIKTVYYGAPDPKAGSCGTLVDLFALPYNHRPTVVSGVMEEACAAILRDFFRALREKRRRLRFQEKSDVADV